MFFSADYAEHLQAIVELVTKTFTASEDPAEGALIGDLALKLMSDTPKQDLQVFFGLGRWGSGCRDLLFAARL